MLLLKRDEEVYSAVSATLRASTAAIIISLIWHGFTALPMRSFRFGAVAFVHQGPENIIPGPWESLRTACTVKVEGWSKDLCFRSPIAIVCVQYFKIFL